MLSFSDVMKKGGMMFLLGVAFVFLISLSIVSAVPQIREITAVGKDGIQNILAEGGDTLTITASVSGAVQSNSLFFVFQNTAEPFTACQSGSNGSVCTYTSSLLRLVQGKYPYRVSLTEGTTLLHTVTKEISVDGMEPVIEQFSLERSNQSIHVAYVVSDQACPDCNGICAGIATVSLLQGHTSLASWDVFESRCAQANNILLPLPELNLGEGDNTLCLVVSDRVGYESVSSCRNLTVDTVPPQFIQESLQFVVANQRMEYFPDTTTRVGDIHLNITDTALDIQVVIGNFSSLNTPRPLEQQSRKAECHVVAEDYYSCVFKNIVVTNPQENPVVEVTARDIQGNVNSQKIVLPLRVDHTAPQLVRVYTTPLAKDVNRLYVTDTNIISAEFSEQESGFHANEVYLQLRDFTQKIRAKNCTNVGAWVCVFEVPIHTEEGVQGVTDFYGTMDDSGQALISSSRSVIVDTQLPEIILAEKSHACPTADQTLTLHTSVHDTSPVFISANAQTISDYREPVQGECIPSSRSPDIYDCTLAIDRLSTGYVDDRLAVTVTDAAGNTAIKEIPVKVCAIEAERTPEFITLDHGAPPKVDKRTLSYLSIPLSIPLMVTLKSNAQIVDARAQCTNSNEAYFVNNFNTLVIKLSQYSAQQENDEKVTSLSVDCNLDFVMKKGTQVYSLPEQEQLALQIPLYHNALGTLDAAVKSKLDETQRRIEELSSSASNWGMLNTIYGKWCQTAEATGAVNSAWQTAKAAWYASDCPIETSAKASCAAASEAVRDCLLAAAPGCATGVCVPAAAACAAAGATAGSAAGPYGAAAGGVGGGAACEGACAAQCVSILNGAAAAVTPGVDTIKGLALAPVGDPALAVASATANQGIVLAAGIAVPPVPVGEISCGIAAGAAITACNTWLATEISWKKACGSTSQYHSAVDEYVWPIGLYGGPVGTFNKYACMIFNKCALTDFDTYVELAVDLGGYGISRTINTKGALGFQGDASVAPKIQEAQIGWQEAAQANMIAGQGTGNWWADPFKNKDVAKYTACLPAWIFGLEKEKQVHCIYKKCLEQRTKAGLPTHDCDLSLKERKCLYVDGASVTGFEFSAFESVGRAVLVNLPNIIFGLAWKGFCAEYITAATECVVPGVCVDHYNVGCAVGGAALTVAEIAEIIQRDFILFETQRKLRGTDYCTS